MRDHSSEVLDTKILANLRSFARSEIFFPRLIQTFEEHGRLSLEELRAAISQQNRAALSAVAHRFKGSSLNLGAVALADQLRIFEERHHPSLSFSEAEREWERLAGLFEETCKALKELNLS